MQHLTPHVVGIDFDNTIVNYDSVFYELALERGWVVEGLPPQKKIVRDYVRGIADGEMKWCQLQALAYGAEINRAKLEDGVRGFLQDCHRSGITWYIVSHKTEFASAASEGPNLRHCASNWLRESLFYPGSGLETGSDNVFFESTRQAKIERICNLGCTIFVDDLEELFLEQTFPEKTLKILFSPSTSTELFGVNHFSSWSDINEYVFGKVGIQPC